MTYSAEYKVPDGKLLRAEVEADGEIEAVSLHGDFFIYPEDELETIQEALKGLPTDSDVETISDTITEHLSMNTQLVGFTPEDVGAVITEALEADTDER